jgi:hypothetical protein
MKAANPWGGPNSKRVGSYMCGDTGRSTHSWYRWRAIGGDTIGPDQPWRYERECQMSGCDAKEFAFDLPDVRDIEILIAFLDQCGMSANDSVLERVRDLISHEGSRDQLGQLPYSSDPREKPFMEGWSQAIGRVVELRAPAALDPTGRHQDPIRRELHATTSRAQALDAFQQWAHTEDGKD